MKATVCVGSTSTVRHGTISRRPSSSWRTHHRKRRRPTSHDRGEKRKHTGSHMQADGAACASLGVARRTTLRIVLLLYTRLVLLWLDGAIVPAGHGGLEPLDTRRASSTSSTSSSALITQLHGVDPSHSLRPRAHMHRGGRPPRSGIAVAAGGAWL